ncbi:BTB/POZ domain-containing protein 6-B-like [Oculina patagonica]
MAVFDEKWQKAKASITERGIFMFNNELLSDVSLVVRASSDEGEPKKSKMAISAHKFVLTSCSPVFFAMFCGELAEKSDSVDLSDCEYEGVLEMLRYTYSGKAELNENNVMQVLYVAKKYILPSLAEECIQFFQENVNAENVFWVLSHAQHYDEKVLEEQCWEMIDKATEEVVKSEGFTKINRSLLEAVVKRDSLTITEIELFKAVDLWATKECERQGLTPDGNMKRRILGDNTLKGIRFPLMQEKEFVSIVLSCKILTPEEVYEIMKYFNSVASTPVGFPEKKRAGSNLSCRRFGGLETCCGWHYLSDDCIDFKIDKEIELHGVRMFGTENGDYVAILRILDPEGNYVVEAKSGKFSSTRVLSQSTCYYGFDILFDNPIFLSKDRKYRVIATMDGPDSSYGIDCFPSVQCHGVTFSFFTADGVNSPDDAQLNDTDVDGGQFAEFLFRLH